MYTVLQHFINRYSYLGDLSGFGNSEKNDGNILKRCPMQRYRLKLEGIDLTFKHVIQFPVVLQK